MTVLVVGGAGYIGYSLINMLEEMEEVESITVFDNLYKQNLNFLTVGKSLHKTTFIKGDILNKYELEKAVQGKDLVIHLAAHVEHPYSYRGNFRYEQINQYGTVVLYDILRETPPQKIIFLSTAAVYGFKNIIDENTLPEPSNYYGKSKLEAEKYLLLLKDLCDVYIIRSGNVFGYNPQLRLDSVVNKFMMEALLYKKISIYGTGEQYRPFIHMDELIGKIRDFSLLDSIVPPGIYNLAQGHLSLNEIKEFLIEKIPDLEFHYVDANMELPSISMKSDKIKLQNELYTSLSVAYEVFQKALRLKKT